MSYGAYLGVTGGTGRTPHQVTTNIGEALGSNYFTKTVTGNYGFVYDASTGYYKSNNYHQHLTKAAETLVAIKDIEMDIKFGVSSETNYDMFTVTIDGVVIVDNISGSQTKNYHLSMRSGEVMTLVYDKDNSGNGGSDIGYVTGPSSSSVTLTYYSMDPYTDSRARKVSKMYIGLNNIARKIKKIYLGVNNLAKLIFGKSEITRFGYVSDLPSNVGNYLPASAELNGEALIYGGYNDSTEKRSYYGAAFTSSGTVSQFVGSSLLRTNFGCGTSLLNNFAVFCGGYNNSDHSVNSMIYVDPSKTITEASDTSVSGLGRAYPFHGSTSNYAIIAGGGWDDGEDDGTISYGIAIDSSKTQSIFNLTTPRRGSGELSFSGGGGSASFNNSVIFSQGDGRYVSDQWYVDAINNSLTVSSLQCPSNSMSTGVYITGGTNKSYAIFGGGTSITVASTYDSSFTLKYLQMPEILCGLSISTDDYLIVRDDKGTIEAQKVRAIDRSLTLTQLEKTSPASHGINGAKANNLMIFTGGRTNNLSECRVSEAYKLI